MPVIDPRLIPLAWMGTAIVVTTIAAVAAVMIISRIKAPEKTAEATLYLIKAGSIIRLVTITSIVVAVSVLCALGPIKGDAAVATLSAIAGYVLGNERANRVERQEENSK